MNDKEFVEEFVARLVRLVKPLKTLSNNQLSKIVIIGEAVEVDRMFPDKGVDQLFKNDVVYAWVYKYVRDNQGLWVK